MEKIIKSVNYITTTTTTTHKIKYSSWPIGEMEKKRRKWRQKKKSKQSQTTLHNVLFVLPIIIIIIRRQNAYLITINTTTITIATIWERNRWNT